MNIYNTQPLLNEIENVVKNGLDKMLSKILQRYDLLEKTHNQLMNLPSIKEALGKDYDDQDVESESESETESNLKSIEFDNIVSCQTTMKFDVLNIESKLDKLEKKYAGLYPMLDKILDKIETLNNDVQKMKSTPIAAATTVATISSSVEPTIVTACENENITFEIKEEDTESVEDDKGVENVEDTESVEEEEKLVEEEDTESVEEEVLKDVVTESVEEEDENVEVLKDQVAENVEEEENDDSKSVETETKSEKSEESLEEATENKEEAEEDLEVITIDDVDYCTNNEENGFIWELTEDGEQGAKVGYLKDGEPFFYAEEN